MAKGGNRGSGAGKSSGSKAVSAARLHQKSGSGSSFGGYTKVNHGNGSFSMKKTGKGK